MIEYPNLTKLCLLDIESMYGLTQEDISRLNDLVKNSKSSEELLALENKASGYVVNSIDEFIELYDEDTDSDLCTYIDQIFNSFIVLWC